MRQEEEGRSAGTSQEAVPGSTRGAPVASASRGGALILDVSGGWSHQDILADGMYDVREGEGSKVTPRHSAREAG